ncbi:hypothetical protein SESBI_00729 [Sesbania bispinosa]|nr:hypothetical protein SESBI_00729 [Sesbania bispinosa]
MVRAFYVVASTETTEDGSPVIKSWLKGVDMKLALRLVCLITSLKDQGAKLYDEEEWMIKVDASEE